MNPDLEHLQNTFLVNVPTYQISTCSDTAIKDGWAGLQWPFLSHCYLLVGDDG